MNQLKPTLDTFDKQLVQELTTRLENAQDYYNSSIEIIQHAPVMDLKEDSFDIITELVNNIKALKVDFPELKQLDALRNIPKWIAKIEQTLGINNNKIAKKGSSKNPLEKLIDINKNLDSIDAISITQVVKQNLKELIKIAPILLVIYFNAFNFTMRGNIYQFGNRI
jgi:hypothetical protein